MSIANFSTGPSIRGGWSHLVALTTLVTFFLVLGHGGHRIVQMLALFAPVLFWLSWRVSMPAIQWLRSATSWLWTMFFVVDGAARAYLLDTYQAAPDAALVQGALANTNAREGSEFVAAHWRSLSVWCALLVAAAALSAYLLLPSRVTASPRTSSKPLLAFACAALVLSAIAYASKPWRRLHPVAYWTQWSASVSALRATWNDQRRQRDELTARARAASPVVERLGSSTVMLVISDSINRDNLSLYGYQRPTTPQLVAQRAQLGEGLMVLRNAWSVDASTLPALRNLFAFGESAASSPQHLLALAKTAGYKVWWISNHDDVAIEQQHARLADVVEMVNRTPGRASSNLDGELLDCVQEALEDHAERKLIVVHLLGAHPHYKLRYPPDQNPFDDAVDDVERKLLLAGRSSWVRNFRQEYDAALLYHDYVVSQTLELSRSVGAAAQARAWMYLSDHGQEVGHVTDHAGHSPNTASGYRIPTLIWRNQTPIGNTAEVMQRPFRSDWAAWTLAELMHLNWTGRRHDRNVLADNYRWMAPTLPSQVTSFID